MRRLSVVQVAACCATLIAAPALAQWSVVSLHPDRSEASNVRAGVDGSQYGTSKPEGGSIHAAKWNGSAGSVVDLNPLNATQSFVFDAEGIYQVGTASFGGSEAGYWTGTSDSWTSLAPAGSTASIASAIRDNVIGGYASFGPARRATLWSGPAFTTRTDLHPVGATESDVAAIDGGQQYGFATIGGDVQAAAWNGSAATFTSLNPAVASQSRLYGADDGSQVGWANVNGKRKASLWQGTVASWIDLTPANADEGEVLAIDGGVQAGFAFLNNSVQATAGVWRGSAGSWEDLSVYLVGSWGETRAFNTWTDGVTRYVGGFGFNQSTSEFEALLWSQPVPEPTTALALVMASSLRVRGRRTDAIGR